MKPEAPTTFLDMPFCQNGDKTIPKTSPDETTEGRFTVEQGFPEETQLPVTRGGIAPNRWDFNGAYYILSAFAFWQQSGGLMTWNSSLSYVPPAIVYYNGVLYVCVGENGPESDMGESVRPTEDANGTYWQTLLSFLSSSENSVLVGQGNTVTLTNDATGTGAFDSDGNVSVPTTVEKATALRTGRGITLTGDTTGTVNQSFDGTADVSIETTTATATKLRTARTITLTGDVTSSAVSFDGTANISIATSLSSSAAVGTMVPNWDKKASRSPNTSYTVSTNGYFMIQHGWSHHGNIYVNDTSLKNPYYVRNGGDEVSIIFVPLKSGDTIYYEANNGYNLWWIPVAS